MDQANRPRTRGLEASEAEEDAKLIRQALQDPSKYIKKGHKLRSDYGGRRTRQDEHSDEEEKLFYQQPAYDDDESEVKLGMKRRRGWGRRGHFRRKMKTGEEGGVEDIKRSMPARLAPTFKEELKPKIVPYNKSLIEFKLIWYKIGDVISTQRNDVKYYAQILGFHTDQYCDRYVSIKWLLPKYKIDLNDPLQPPLNINAFHGAVPEDEIIKLCCFQFVLRPPPNHFTPDNPHVVTRTNSYIYKNKICSFDSPTFTLTSCGRRY